MAEKGGKGFSNLKGKGGGGNLPRQKKKVVIHTSSDSDSEPASPSPKTTPSTKSTADWGKAGKPKSGLGDLKGGGTTAKPDPPKIPQTPKFDIQAELPKNTECMMDCEAQDVLLKIQEHLVTLSEDPTIKLPEAFHKGLQYGKSSASSYTNVESARRVLEKLKNQKVSESEICLIGNICPETVEEVYALIPGLKETRKKNGKVVEEVVRELGKFRAVA